MSAKHYLVYGHTAKGYINLINSNLKPLDKLYLLKGDPGSGKQSLMKGLASCLEEFDANVEYLHSPSDPDDFDGVLFPTLGVGIVDASSPQGIEPRAPGSLDEFINLGTDRDTGKLADRSEQILQLQSQMKQCYERAYAEFEMGLKIHDEWEKIYIGNMNFTKADQLTATVIARLLSTTQLNKPACIKHRFFGGSTPLGPMDYVENITGDITTRFFIKGRPGSGKSTMLKKILGAASSRGIDTEVYHCGFDPDSLDMLLFPELDLCIFDSTSPHEYYPSRVGDIIIDMYEELITEGTDELYAKELTDIVKRYQSHTKAGTAHLAAAKGYRKELAQLYDNATDFSVIDQLCDELYQKIRNTRPSL